MPENQTAWNSDNQGIKEAVNQTGRRERGRRVDREPGARWQIVRARLAERTHKEAGAG